MHISEIIIDGFKSYASRTVLSGFDESFNAITGLNGSGKSNILDAICFVLGISNLSQVRVTNLQELVYKQGQAGVTKASVTVVFDNSDRARSPPGYEEYSQITVARQVVIGGKNKYLINGHTAQLNRVQNLFHSVQLNVNNPHFLIMQGRITKVLNMKPPEILGMVEEAAGTRMYEMKKTNAHKTMQKKDKKLEEIEKILSDEIVPTLNRLKQDRERYVQWSSLREKCEEMERFCLAYQYFSCIQGEKELKEKAKEAQARIKRLKEQAEEAESEEQEITEQIESLRSKKKSSRKSTSEDPDKQAVELSKELVKKTATAQHKREELEAEQAKLASIEKQIKSDAEEIEKVRAQYEKSQNESEQAKQEVEQLTQKVSALQDQHESVSAGVDVADEGEGTVTEQLMSLKKAQAELATELQKAELKLKHLSSSLKEKQNTLSKSTKQDEEMKRVSEKRSTELDALVKQKNDLGFDPVAYAETEQQIGKIERDSISKIEQEINKLSSELAQFYFDYDKNAVPSDSVMGMVAELFEVKDPARSCTALEVAAGGRLYQVVVDNEKTAKQLIQQGKPNRRVTVIPLNKIQFPNLPEQVVKRAEKMNAKPALMLIEYEKDVEPAMKYAFGKTLVCESLDQAEKVAFHPDILTRTVTLDGDVFDPSGTLTGGSRRNNSGSSTVAKLGRLRKLKAQLSQEKQQLADLRQKLDVKQQEHYNILAQKCELKQHELNLVLSRQEQSSNAQLRRQCEEIQTETAELNKRIPVIQEEIQENEEKIAELEKKVKGSDNTNSADKRREQLDRIEKNQKQAKQRLQVAKQRLRDLDQKSQKLQLQVEEMESESTDNDKKVSELTKSIEKLKTECKKLDASAETAQEEYDEVKQKVEELQAQRARADQQTSELNSRKDRLAKKRTDLSIEINKAEQEQQAAAKDASGCQQTATKLERENTWIKSEKSQFGKANTAFDFSNTTLEGARTTLSNLQADLNRSSKTVNKKVMSMYDKADKEYRDLMDKRGIVESDKKKIENVIVELDDKKKEAIKKTWSKVNADFASIFSTLLPGAKGKLDPWREDGKEGDMEGLEVRVGFGQVWKQSLTELSGGQRSLLALSLILALLLFKPAPMYILDEIDAALDPSHTQNIGRMLKTHFTNSQFIVVSLKEGMFQNANVLFRTKFVNGQSTVARIASHRSAITDEQMDKENGQLIRSGKENQVDHSAENRKALASVSNAKQPPRKRTKLL
jgi:structural maintenance of chromosome 2